ncbi:histidine phosphatase family protein [Actinomycetospora chibensis]|uniref:Histidine phosphatase family protein n=1 Tax=Actinomycetospora chibensis TaxID=663606 RepID=A0ABV9RST4_9PSEU|nr:histidine phosphatase family protein [Actinomycetospora chibensis]MDD7926386.1 histidine phosphatase family protein [Actinomycetospora chibensis]
MRLHLLAHAATEASRAARFPRDEPLDAGGRRTAGELAGRLREPDLLWCAPSARCRATTALALPGREPDGDAPAGPDPGAWAGRSPAELAAEDPAALQAWMTDAEAGPPGGESLWALVDRVAGWMDGLPGDERSVGLAVVDPPVVRAAVAHTLGAGPAGAWRVDVAPLTLAVLTGRSGRWNLRSLGAAGCVPSIREPGPDRPH